MTTISYHKMPFGLTLKVWDENSAIVLPPESGILPDGTEMRQARFATEEEYEQLPSEYVIYEDDGNDTPTTLTDKEGNDLFCVFDSEVESATANAKYYAADESDPDATLISELYQLVLLKVEKSER